MATYIRMYNIFAQDYNRRLEEEGDEKKEPMSLFDETEPQFGWKDFDLQPLTFNVPKKGLNVLAMFIVKSVRVRLCFAASLFPSTTLSFGHALCHSFPLFLDPICIVSSI